MKTALVCFPEHRDAIMRVRNTVFTLEQGVDPAIDFDGFDHEAIHVLCSDNDLPVGTGRILNDGHIGRVAVLAEYRSRGVGTQIVTLLIDTARAGAFDRVFLYAQINAIPFYDKLGFAVCGENTIEAGIVHSPMELRFIDEGKP
jgi:hypothetical protein